MCLNMTSDTVPVIITADIDEKIPEKKCTRCHLYKSLEYFQSQYRSVIKTCSDCRLYERTRPRKPNTSQEYKDLRKAYARTARVKKKLQRAIMMAEINAQYDVLR